MDENRGMGWVEMMMTTTMIMIMVVGEQVRRGRSRCSRRSCDRMVRAATGRRMDGSAGEEDD
jgi:hypothetical protein